jgi:hypothetical protein
MLALATALVLALGGSAPVRVTVAAPGHTPRIGPRWYYTVRVSTAGKPAAARLTEQIVDPLGGTHPVEFGPTTKDITNWPFRGRFRDYIIWPKDGRGIPLTFRVIVSVGGKKHVVDYRVTPRA